MWLSKFSKPSKDGEKNSQTVQNVSESQQHSQNTKDVFYSQKKRRASSREEEGTDISFKLCEKPSPAKRTRHAQSSYEDDVSDDEHVVIELFSSDEQGMLSTSKTKGLSKISSSQKKKSTSDAVKTATNSQVSPIFDTTSIFRKYQNQSKDVRDKRGLKCDDDSAPMFTQQEESVDLPLLPWPKKRTKPLSQSSNSSKSQGSQSPNRNSSTSMSQVVRGVISNIREDSSSDSDETFASKIQKRIHDAPCTKTITGACYEASHKQVTSEFEKTSSGKVPSDLSPVFLSLRTNKPSLKQKKTGYASSDSSDLVVVETVSEESGRDFSRNNEEGLFDEFLTIGRNKKGGDMKNLETHTKQNTKLQPGKTRKKRVYSYQSHDDNTTLSSQCRGESTVARGRKKKVRKSFQLTSDDSDDDSLSSCKPLLTNKSKALCSARVIHKPDSVKKQHKVPVYFSDDDISCHSEESTEEYDYTSPSKDNPTDPTKATDSQATQEYVFDDQPGPRTSYVIPDSSLVVSQSAKEKLKKIISPRKKDNLYAVHPVEDDATQFGDQVKESSVQNSESSQSILNVSRMNEQRNKAIIDEISVDSDARVSDSEDDLTQAPDSGCDSHHNASDVVVIGLEEDPTQTLDNPSSDDDMTQEYSQTLYGNPPQLSLAVRPQSLAFSSAGSILGGPPQLSQQVSRPASVSCVSPASTVAYDSDSWHSNNTATFTDYDSELKCNTTLKRIENRSGGSTDSTASESCLRFKPLSKTNEKTACLSSETQDVSSKKPILAKINDIVSASNKQEKDLCHTELERTWFTPVIHKKASTPNLAPSKSVAFNFDTFIDTKAEDFSCGVEEIKIKEEKLETEPVSELPAKLPCYTQEEDVIFVYDSSDDEALVDLSQTNIRSDHLSDADSMYDMFDHSDTELFDDNFGDSSMTLVSKTHHEGDLEDLALEAKNPFDHLGESDSEDAHKASTKTGGKSTFNLETESDDVPSGIKHVQIPQTEGKKNVSIHEISSDSDNNEIAPGHTSRQETSGHDSFDMDLDDDIYFAATQVANNIELLDPQEQGKDISDISAETLIQPVSDLKPIHTESDSSIFSAATEVATAESDNDANDIQSVKTDFGNYGTEMSHELKQNLATRELKNRGIQRQIVSTLDDGESSDSALSDENLYLAATQMDLNVAKVLEDITVEKSRKKSVTDVNITPQVTCEGKVSNSQKTVGNQGKPKRKTASVRSFINSSMKTDFKSVSASTPRNESIFDAATQIDDISLPSRDPFKTSTPKISEGKSKPLSLFQMKKLNFSELYNAQTQAMSSNLDVSASKNQVSIEDSDVEPDDDALYKALDDLEETDLSCLDTNRHQKHHSDKDSSFQMARHTSDNHQEDVFVAATQIDPGILELHGSDSGNEGLPDLGDKKPMEVISDEDPFTVMTQVDGPLPVKSPERTDQSTLVKVPELLLKKIMSKHKQNKSILVAPERLKKRSGDMQSDKKGIEKNNENMIPAGVQVSKSKFSSVKSSWLSKKKSPPVSKKVGTSTLNKKKKLMPSDSFSLTQKIQAAKERKKERAFKTVVDPSLPTAKMKQTGNHAQSANNSDVTLPDDDEIRSKGLPLMYTKLYDKPKHDKSGKGQLEKRKQMDIELEDSRGVVTDSISANIVPPPAGIDVPKREGKVMKKHDKDSSSSSSKPSSTKSSSSSSKSSSSSHSKHKSSKSEKLSTSPRPCSSKSSSSKHRSHSSSNKSSNSSSGSSKTSSFSSKHSHNLSKSSVTSKNLSSSSKSSSNSSKSSSSKKSSASSKLSSRPPCHLVEPLKLESSSCTTDQSERSTLSKKDYVALHHKSRDPAVINPQEKSIMDDLAKERTGNTQTTAPPTVQADKSFDLSLYPLPAVKAMDISVKPTVSPQLCNDLAVKPHIPVNVSLQKEQGTADIATNNRSVSNTFLNKSSEYSSSAKLPTPHPAQHGNDLPMETLLQSDNDAGRGVKKQQISKVTPVTKPDVPSVSRDPRMKYPPTTSRGQNLLLKPSAAVHPVVAVPTRLSRPMMGRLAVDTILPFSQMLTGAIRQPSTTTVHAASTAEVVKDPSKLMDSTFYMSRVLSWNPVWLEEQSKPEFSGHPPPILQSEESVYPLLESYTNLEDYQSIMTRLLLLETWDMIVKEWKQKKVKTETKVMFSSVDLCNKQDKGSLSKFIWQGVLTREQFRRNQYPVEGDLIIMNVWGVPLTSQKHDNKTSIQPSWKLQFGYVERMNIRPSDNIHNLLRTYPVLKSSIDNQHGEFHILTVTALGRYRRFRPVSDRIMSLEPLCHMVTVRRQFQALTYLPRSPLLRDILHPSSHRVFHHNTLVQDTSLLRVYNQSQAEAISAVCRAVREPTHMPRICLLQGPPGTGKTHTITGIITKIIQESHGKCCICLCTPSNGAADELMRRLIALRNNGGRNASMRLVRFGKTKSIHDDVLECAYDELVDKERKKEEDRKKRNLSSLPESVKREQQQLQQKIEKLQKELATLTVSANKIQIDRRQADLRKYERELRYLDTQQTTPHQVVQLTAAEEAKIRQHVLREAHVICGTLNSIGSARIMNILRSERNRNPFLCTVIDEATQASELDCLIPLQYGVSKLVLVGDPEQLPPTIISQRAKEMKFGLSLFERFYTYFKSKDQTAVMMLKTQYRMDAAILTFPNLYVYDGQLNTDRSVAERTKNFPLHPYLVLNIEPGQEVVSTEGSVSNQTEATCVAELCHIIVSRTKIPPARIGVICPYQSQKAIVINSLSHRRLRDVEVNTVDGFQGREKHVIIMSCVRARSNDGSIGFLSDRRRMNVALTRAKYALYVLGHLDTLKRGPDWRALIDDAQRRNVIRNVPSVNQFNSVAAQCFKTHRASH